MSDDLVSRLKSPEVFISIGGMTSLVAHEAADRIEAQAARIVELEVAIRTAAECIDADDAIAARGFLSDVLIKKYKPKWVCPNNTPGCVKNCGNYGCGN